MKQITEHNTTSAVLIPPNVKLTKEEALLIADVLNGQVESLFWAGNVSALKILLGDDRFANQASPFELDSTGRVVMRGSRVASGLEHEIYDAIRLDELDKKWSVDGLTLLNKIRSMNSIGRLCLLDAVRSAWQQRGVKNAFQSILVDTLVTQGVEALA
jgi:hypothetical protein